MLQELAIINGPNLNLLGSREPEIYGHNTLDQLNDKLATIAHQYDFGLKCMQSNAEHDLIEAVQSNTADFVIINAGALAHTSIGLRDALLANSTPFIEVHISNTFAREEFRRHSYLSDIAVGVITGLGTKGYELAVEAAVDFLK